MKLKNRIAVIAGGSSGIGLATTQEFKVQGAGGNYLERNVEAVVKAGKEIGGDTVGLTADVSRVADLDRAFQLTGGVPLLWPPVSVSPRKAFECSSLAVANPSLTVKFTYTV